MQVAAVLGKGDEALGLVEIVVLGVALSADAFAVTVSNCFAYASESRARLALMPVAFGLFQGIMPLTGYFVGGFAAELIEAYAGIVTLVTLGFVGGNMVREGVLSLMGKGEGPTAGPVARRLTIVALLLQAVATSIDAFAVGVSLRAQAVSIAEAAGVIALTTLLCCFVALAIGRQVGQRLGDKAQVVGGLVLVAIGVKALLS